MMKKWIKEQLVQLKIETKHYGYQACYIFLVMLTKFSKFSGIFLDLYMFHG